MVFQEQFLITREDPLARIIAACRSLERHKCAAIIISHISVKRISDKEYQKVVGEPPDSVNRQPVELEAEMDKLAADVLHRLRRQFSRQSDN